MDKFGVPAVTGEAMGIKNSTTTFTQSWGSTQGRLVRVEVLVLFSALIWILVKFFGSRRRRYSQGFFRFFVWVVYTLFTVLGPYTIGLLQDGPFRDQTFVLWGTILLFIQVSVDSLSVYSIHDIEQRKRMLVQHLIQIILVLWLIVNCKGHNKSYTVNIWLFWIQSVILTYTKYQSLSNASKKGGLLKLSKVVADYMMIEHEQIPRDFNPGTMEGYKYIFHGEEQVASLLPTAPEYRVKFTEATRRKYTAIDSVWRWIERESAFNQEAKETLKDVALSFSLFKLLKRRLCGYQIGEAGLAKTLDFVLKGLISERGNYVRAFGVIEMELSFLYDFLYTRFDTEYSSFKGWALCFVIITVIVSNSISGAFSRHYHRSSLEQRVHGIDVTRWVTIVLLIIVCASYLVAAATQDWRWDIVDELHSNERPTWETGLVETSSVKRKAKKSWQRALGQHSLLLNFDYHPRNVLSLLSLGLVDPTREGQKAGETIKLTDELIERVLSRFKKSKGQLQDGQSALAKNQLGSQFSWACTLSTHIHKILVWHVGTTIAMDGHPVPPTGDHRVAKTLSDYCAYLVAFVPDMLPGHGYDTQRIFDAVVVEARESISGCDSLSSRCEKLVMAVLPSNSSCTILELGGRLGRELRGVVPEEQRWKVLADFWAEFILFLAPSSNVEIHTEMLAAGGEFMTHL
ncbi:hypothetical protein SETIT_4G016200v2 [Setaria italica]|uniref:DUF4220 domain-containing protein n=2 Tax=Setaria italica TaxID=4555 RepID=A0A368QPN3_SETIT|nr:uncharacterized protein LOC101776199 [Setaria italica]XP_004964392.1 uncharacterized protein LOC101776199 [Setaria italica]RCV19937.1 hypothetical protein SETIT_4G016200v2 [Setaria italica]